MHGNIRISAWSRKRPSAWGRIARAVIVLCLAGAAHAQDAADQHRCTGEWRGTLEQRIAACATLIDSGRYQGVNLAILHDNRGMARREQGDLDRAIEDFNQAIRLQPNFAEAFYDRSLARRSLRDIEGADSDLAEAKRLGLKPG